MEAEQKDKIQQDKNKDVNTYLRKSKLLFLLYLMMGAFAGATISAVVDEEGALALYQSLGSFAIGHARELVYGILVIFIILNLLFIFWVLSTVKRCEKNMKELKEDDYLAVERIEQKLSNVLGCSNLLMIAGYFLFSFATYLFVKSDSRQGAGTFSVLAVIFVASTVLSPFLQQKIINVVKMINPEKKGSVYDPRFVKKWEESCDERELLAIYRAAYKSFRAVNSTCLLLWVVFIISGLLTGIGFGPAMTVLVIWGVSNCVYHYHSTKC